MLLDEDERIIDLIVEIVELHRTTLKGVLLEKLLLLLCLPRRHQDTLLQEMGRRDHRVSVQLAVVLDLLDSYEVSLSVLFRSDVGVSWTVVNCMTNLLAAVAPNVLLPLRLRLCSINVILFLFL